MNLRQHLGVGLFSGPEFPRHSLVRLLWRCFARPLDICIQIRPETDNSRYWRFHRVAWSIGGL